MSSRVVAVLASVLVGLVSCTMSDGPTVAKAGSALGWSQVDPPIHIRSLHTTTLLGTGELLVAGGASSPSTTEILEVASGRTVTGPALLAPRRQHTATMLANGKVLVAGGQGQSSAELYDPVARTFTATGSLARPRASHVAVRLDSGKVLVVGGAADRSTELYDAASGTFTVGPDRAGTNPPVAALLADGRVLVAALDAIELYDPARNAWSTIPAGVGGDVGTLTRAASGQMFLAVTTGCFSVGGDSLRCDSFVYGYDPPTNRFSGAVTMPNGRTGFGAARLPGDQLLFVGFATAVDTFVPATRSFTTSDGTLSSAYAGPTTTVLPGGDLLVLGGAQAAIDRRVATGSWRSGPSLATGRQRHAAVRIHDGRVLVSGGIDAAFAPIRSTELLDTASGTVVAGPVMLNARERHTMTALRDGTVLVAGGAGRTAELFTPGAGFGALPEMTAARADHAAVLLPTGKVLLVAGDAAGSAELFDPGARRFEALPAPATGKDGAKGAVLMPNGRVLLVGGSQAEIFDPLTSTFRTVNAPGAPRDGRSARLLASGKVLVAGGETLAAEVFDPASEQWSFVARRADAYANALWGTRPTGPIVTAGGALRDRAQGTTFVFDSLGAESGSFLATGPLSTAVVQGAITLGGSGELVVTGGNSCQALCAADPRPETDVLGDGAVGPRPSITDVPRDVIAGSRVRITGSGFTRGPEASSGSTNASSTNHPLAYWVSDANDGVVMGTILDFTDTTATWLVPATALHGHGQLFVGSSGVTSRGVGVTLSPALAATGCANDAECAGGFCVDGVCCDRRCDGACEGCSAAHKLSGEDGVCGAVPPGRDISGRCGLRLGDACAAKEECGPNFCAGANAGAPGVCCDAACDGECLSCSQPGHLGQCTPVDNGACNATVCIDDHTSRSVAGGVRDCGAFKCEDNVCRTSCSSVNNCVTPNVCSLEGLCVPPPTVAPSDVSVFGCAQAPGRGDARAALGLVALALLAGRRRCRTR